MSESRISEAQLKANRENAKKSTGPTSEEGKNKSKMNGRIHGFTGQVFIETEEEHEEFVAFSKKYLEDLAPEGMVETDLVHAIISAAWRRNRMAASENNYLSLRLATGGDRIRTPHPPVHTALMHAQITLDRSKDFCNTALYEQRLTNTYQKNLKMFLEMKKNRLLNQSVVQPHVQTKTMACGAGSQPSSQPVVPFRADSAAEGPRADRAGHETVESSATSGQIGFAFSNQNATAKPEEPLLAEPLKLAS